MIASNAMLFSPEAHEPLEQRSWNRDVVLAAIRDIAAECEGSLTGPPYWPVHPRDVEPGDEGPWTTVYLGSAGVIYALDLLAGRDLVDLARDYVPVLEQAVEAYTANPEGGDWVHPPSYWTGETGILLVLQRLAPSAEIESRIAELVAANADDPHREFMLGSPGTMLAARGIGRRDLWEESAARLRDAREESGLWTQEFGGRRRCHLGPAHGFTGCVAALDHEPDDELHRCASEAFKRQAVKEDGLANWPPFADGDLIQSDGTIRVQWCHGAPGMVASLARIAPGDDEHERLLVAGAELTWRAGPLAKGANLCHGTAGNGLAFLKLFERTGDELWLERARAFAMHAVAQVERERSELGRGRYSLWTGDPGTALYLALCLEATATLPSFDDNDFA